MTNLVHQAVDFNSKSVTGFYTNSGGDESCNRRRLCSLCNVTQHDHRHGLAPEAVCVARSEPLMSGVLASSRETNDGWESEGQTKSPLQNRRRRTCVQLLLVVVTAARHQPDASSVNIGFLVRLLVALPHGMVISETAPAAQTSRKSASVFYSIVNLSQRREPRTHVFCACGSLRCSPPWKQLRTQTGPEARNNAGPCQSVAIGRVRMCKSHPNLLQLDECRNGVRHELINLADRPRVRMLDSKKCLDQRAQRAKFGLAHNQESNVVCASAATDVKNQTLVLVSKPCVVPRLIPLAVSSACKKNVCRTIPKQFLSCSDSRILNLYRPTRTSSDGTLTQIVELHPILHRIPEHCHLEDWQTMNHRNPVLCHERQ